MKSDKPRCGAKTRSGGTCQKFPLLGGKRCAKHGGGAPQVRRKNKQRLERYAVEKKVAREVQALSVDAIDGVTDPLAELQRLTTEAIHFKDALGRMVNDLEKDISTYSSDGVEHARTVIDLYGAAMDRRQTSRNRRSKSRRCWCSTHAHTQRAKPATRTNRESTQNYGRRIPQTRARSGRRITDKWVGGWYG